MFVYDKEHLDSLWYLSSWDTVSQKGLSMSRDPAQCHRQILRVWRMRHFCVMATKSKQSSRGRLAWTNSWLTSRLVMVMASSSRKSCPWDGRGRLDSVVLNWACIKAHVYTHDSWRCFLQTCPWVLGTLVDQSGQQMILLVWAPRGSWGSREDVAMENKPTSGMCFSRSLQRERQSILCVDNFYICGFN